jgi:serine/threonine-protein kinase RsbW
VSAFFETQVLPRPEAISAFTEQVMDYLAGAGIDTRTAHHVALAFDELLTNLGSHGGGADKPATVRVIVESDKVRAEIRDTGAPFDIREAAEPVLNQTIEEREIGGLGLFLIRQFASEIGYERRDGTNCTSFAVLRNVLP